MTTPLTTLELAKIIKQEPANIRRKAEGLNGQVNFDRDADTFTAEQLRAFLPEYLTGNRPLKGEKRKAVERLLMDLDGAINAPVNRPINKPVDAPVNKQVNRRSTPVNAHKSKAINSNARKWLFLSVAVVGVFWQASHFAHLEAIDSPFNGAGKYVVAWGIAIGFESLALLLTVFSDKHSLATWGWLIGFAIIGVFMNLSFYGVIDDVIDGDFWRRIILSIALPFSIVATTHLFISNKQQ